MELFVLGSGSCTPTPERGSSGLALSFLSHLIFFDGGGGSLRQMAKLGLDFRQVDYLCITHFHPDHVADLIPFLFAMNYTIDFTRSLPLHMLGPSGFKAFYAQLRGIFGHWIEAQTYPLYFHEVQEEFLSFPNFFLEILPMVHSAVSIGFRLNAEGRLLAYSGDTDYCSNVVQLGREADLLILECSFPDERKTPGHLTPSLAGKIAKESNCKKLLLTHFYPIFEGHDILKECQKEYSGEVLLAEDGMKLTI